MANPDSPISAEEVLAKLRGKRCRVCGERFEPMYGRIKRESAQPFSARSVRVAVEGTVDDEAGTYFECFECESKLRRRRIWIWSILAGLVLLAVIVRWLLTGELPS